MPSRLYGHVENVPIGATFPDRLALAKVGVHRATQAGITGGGDGTESIVLNAGYADDVDHGDEVIYTGHGGRNPNTTRNCRSRSGRVYGGQVTCRRIGRGCTPVSKSGLAGGRGESCGSRG